MFYRQLGPCTRLDFVVVGLEILIDLINSICCQIMIVANLDFRSETPNFQETHYM